MTAEEKFRVGWVRGCDGREVAFVDEFTLAYASGGFLKFKSVFTGKESIQERPEAASLGVSATAVHPVESGVLAFADVGPGATVYVIKYPSGERISTLKGGGRLDVVKLAFSSTDHIAALGSAPDRKITVWNFRTGVEMCGAHLETTTTAAEEEGGRGGVDDNNNNNNNNNNYEENEESSVSISFSPFGWRRLCVTSPNAIVIISIERSNVKFRMIWKRVPILALDGSDPLGDRQRALRQFLSAARAKTSLIDVDDDDEHGPPATAAGVDASSNTTTTKTGLVNKHVADLPPHAVAGLNGQLAERYFFSSFPFFLSFFLSFFSYFLLSFFLSLPFDGSISNAGCVVR